MGLFDKYKAWEKKREVARERSQLQTYQEDRAKAVRLEAAAAREERLERAEGRVARAEERIHKVKSARFQRKTAGASKVLKSVGSFLSLSEPKARRSSSRKGGGHRPRRSRPKRSVLADYF